MQNVLEELRRRVTLGGTIRAPSGDAISGIAVTATPGERKKRKSAAGFVETGPTTRTVSKGNGCFGFVDLPPGVYRVTARCDAWAADRFLSLEGHDDIEVGLSDPVATPLPPPHVGIVLAVRATDGELRGRAARKDATRKPVPLDRARPGTRLIEFS